MEKKRKDYKRSRKFNYSDDPVLLEAFKTGKWPESMPWKEAWGAAHAIAARGYGKVIRRFTDNNHD